ncbi:hypothetical protein ACSMFR_05875 [Listeria aquatica]|uniref:hypothetical protein n=1 Tax=Listeria aquatica TaxID=1494960 RepID=UPI003F71D42E
MDLVNEKRTQTLQQLKKQQEQVENKLQTFHQKQGELEWLEADYQSHMRAQTELRELLQEGWQGDTARGFHNYLDEVQEQEQRTWKQAFQTQKEALQEEISQLKHEQIYSL